MNKHLTDIPLYKACFTACLFLLAPAILPAQDLPFNERSQKAYQFILDLQPTEAMALLEKSETAAECYVAGLAEAVDLVITEDVTKFKRYEAQHERRLEQKIKGSDADYQFVQAELRLQWAFVYFVFGHEIDAASNLRQAYFIADECRKKYPKYLPIKKTTGILDVIIGSVPEKYNWVLGLLGMQGSIQAGLDNLSILKTSSSYLAFEASLYHALIHGFVFQKPDVGLAEIEKLQASWSPRLILSLGASLAIKNAQSEKALGKLDTLSAGRGTLPLYFIDYMKGEVYLHKADYLNSISAYRWFVNNYKGQNYGKDAYYKIGLCYWLNGNVNDALAVFDEAKSKGKELSEADKYAARSLAEKELPNVKLSKVRYYTDGGYYHQANQLLQTIRTTDIPTARDQVEYHYRKARLMHKMSEVQKAKTAYQQTIDTAGNANWYFAPNSYLQLGYIALEEKDTTQAIQHFNSALSFKKHEYKNSIDIKAKSALSQITRK